MFENEIFYQLSLQYISIALIQNGYLSKYIILLVL